jgi:benzil reductase ((S)-benzoin forming)
MVERLLSPENTLFCVSRSADGKLMQDAEKRGVRIRWITADLCSPQEAGSILDRCADDIDLHGCKHLVLINNAATLEPMGPVGTADPDQIAQAVALNLSAPLILTNAFVARFGQSTVPRTVINVSSGAGSSPMAGLSTYSTTKAGINMFTRAAANDAEHSPDDPSGTIRFFAVSPGTVDTDMQKALRTADESVLPEHSTYVKWKREGALISPAESARKILSLVARTDIQSGMYVHSRDL